MTWKKSGAGSSSKRRLIAALAALAVLILAAGFFGPSFLLRLALDRFAADFIFAYERAEAGPFFRSARVFGPALTDPATGDRLRADLVEASGLKPLNFFRTAPGLKLADDLDFLNLQTRQGDLTFSDDRLTFSSLRRPGPEAALPFAVLWGDGLRVSGLGERRLSLAYMRLAAPPEDPVCRLELRGLNLSDPALAGGLTLELDRLTAETPKASVDRFLKKAREGERDLWSNIWAAIWVGGGGSLNLELTLETAALAPLGPFWTALADLAEGAPLPLSFSAAAEAGAAPAGARRGNVILESPGLGRLELEIRLEGLPDSLSAGLAAPEARTAAALLGARLAGASLYFKDDGFMAKYYAYLSRTKFFRDASGRPVPGLIQERWLKPFLRGLGGDAALIDPAGLAAEAEIFLRAPESFKIEAAPEKPPPLRRLVIPGKYAILERLGLTITINGRPARPVSFASGPAPQPPSAEDASP